MKQLIALVMLMMMMVSCTPNGEEITLNNSIKPTNNYRIVIIDGCEYIEVDAYKIYTLTHKGNCNNSIH
jgi:hypothetical protein